jgi:hypothetical protein
MKGLAEMKKIELAPFFQYEKSNNSQKTEHQNANPHIIIEDIDVMDPGEIGLGEITGRRGIGGDFTIGNNYLSYFRELKTLNRTLKNTTLSFLPKT